MKLTRAFSPSGFAMSLFFAIIATLISGLIAHFFLGLLEQAHLTAARKSLATTAGLLTTHYQVEFDHFVGAIVDDGGAISHSSNGFFATGATGLLEADPEILDISLWKKGVPSQRVYLAINSHFSEIRNSGANTDILSQIEAVVPTERGLILPSFQGNTLIFRSPLQLAQKKYAWIAAPLGKGSVEEVVAAHISLDKFQRAFRGDSQWSGYLRDPLGNILIRMGPLEASSKIEEWGKIDLGSLMLSISVPEAEITAVIQPVRKQLFAVLSLTFLTLFLIAYSSIVRFSGRSRSKSLGELQNEFSQMIEEEGVELNSGQGLDIPTLESPVKKWFVNNGSQVMGPFIEKEISLKLFEQEFDFDCECWEEGTGNASQIQYAGIYSGSGDSGAPYWMFDGETIHGPVSVGFIKTAIGHGAIRDHVYICERATVNGWKPLSEFDWETPEDPLRASLEPPDKVVSTLKAS